MSKRSYVKDNIVYDCGLPKSPEECSAIINNLEEIASKWQHKCEEKDKQLVISELEKLRDFFLEPYKDEEMGTEFIITKDASDIADYVLGKIKKLKEDE